MRVFDDPSARITATVSASVTAKAHASVPSVAELTRTLRELVPCVARFGTFNMLLSNGEALWAHGSTKLCYVVRQHPFATARLADEDLSVNFAEHTTPDDRVAVVATTPLTCDEQWTPFAPGELKVFVDGAPMADAPHAPDCYNK